MAFPQILMILVSTMQLISASTGNCDIYENLERNVSCGSNGYLLQYGMKNCRIFNAPEIVSRFTAAGQRFLNCTRDCLIDHIEELFKRSRPTCDVIYSSAVESHANCYLKCDFCKICKTEKLALFSSYDLMDFLSIKSVKTIFKVLKKCGLMTCLNIF
uniref:Uncharacterized protein n=1 Tax=Haemonchus contortus TaxID=6289 RepID=A0A7I4XUT2_HAECO